MRFRPIKFLWSPLLVRDLIASLEGAKAELAGQDKARHLNSAPLQNETTGYPRLSPWCEVTSDASDYRPFERQT
ncbi:hypothetical protein BGZ63DRAFT_381402 [Mariannaea sp. PMI_226]|nr:hypothetical protein BGZ63DRAFT_381402 [Mariannaea sp. PMI_226]